MLDQSGKFKFVFLGFIVISDPYLFQEIVFYKNQKMCGHGCSGNH